MSPLIEVKPSFIKDSLEQGVCYILQTDNAEYKENLIEDIISPISDYDEIIELRHYFDEHLQTGLFTLFRRFNEDKTIAVFISTVKNEVFEIFITAEHIHNNDIFVSSVPLVPF